MAIFQNYLSMSDKNLLDNIKKLRELTGVGFKDCKIALDENNGDIDDMREIEEESIILCTYI